MRITLLASKHPKLIRFFESCTIIFSSLLLRCLSTESTTLPSAPPQQYDDSNVKQAVQLLQIPDHEWNTTQLNHLLFSNPAPSSHLLFQIARRLPSSSQALKFLEFLQDNSPLPDTQFLSSTFQTIFGSLVLYKTSKEWNIPLTINSAILLLRCFGRNGLNTQVRNVFIKLLQKAGPVDNAFKVLDEMLRPEFDYRPDDVTGDIIFSWLMKREHFGLVLKFGEFVVFHNSIWITRMIAVLCRNGRTIKAYMEKTKEMDIEPDVITVGILIDHLCKFRRIDEALEVFQRMNGFGRQEEGLGLLERIKFQKKCAPNTVIYNCLIDDFCKADEIKGVVPNEITINTLVNGMCRSGRTNIAVQVLDEMERKAMEIFYQMLREGCFPDAVVYCKLISGLSQAGKMDDAVSVLSKLKEAGFHPDVNRMDRVQEMLKAGINPDSITHNMIKAGLSPAAVTYGALVRAYCLNGNVYKAMKVFIDMDAASKVPPNTEMYNILIDSLCKNNDVELAVSLIDGMKVKGVRPNMTTYNAIFKGLREKKSLKPAFELMDKMREQTSNPDYITMEILTEWLSAVGEIEK
ncbi:hypothetical protein P3X46_003655 [Hevea brasiliensis]|uniref:Pentacotripeptide-repeat region of PRORP domain-containing protein n=1 Tax=Hevea brasiliensis TaxID=3981 RepID=A0ABQ9N6X5_HEVBR|nr:hypothetical protein P3X46_003655 [Hevea brasiliensis]